MRWIASSSPRCRTKPSSVPPVPFVKASTGLSLKMAFTSLNSSTIIGMNSARPPFNPYICATVVGVAGTPEGIGCMAGGRLFCRPGSGFAVKVEMNRDISTA
jgi:hypothetical protein